MSEDQEAPATTKRKTRGPRPGQIPNMNGAWSSPMLVSGSDLVAHWELPPQSFAEGLLKLGRKLPASEAIELVWSGPLGEYEMERVAREYGPGRYVLVLGADPGKRWGMRNSSLAISPDYAGRAGWQAAAPPPRVADLRTYQETAAAVAPPAQGRPAFGPEQIAALVETVVSATLARIPPPQPAPQIGIMEMLAMLNNERKSSMELVMNLSGLNPKALKSAEEEVSWPNIIKEALPVVAGVAQSIFSRPAEPQAAPAPVRQPVQSPAAQPVAMLQTAAPAPAPVTPEEAQKFSGAVAMLRPFVGHILKALEAGPVDLVATELAGFVPGRLEDDLLDLATLVESRGPAVLSLIHADLATEKGKELILAIASKILED